MTNNHNLIYNKHDLSGKLLVQGLLTLGFGGGSLSYAEQIESLFGSNIIGYWKFDELSGTDAIDSSSQGNDGVYSGATLNSVSMPSKIGGVAPRFDGVNDFVNLVSSGVSSDFDGDEGTLILWMKMYEEGDWSGGFKIFSSFASAGLTNHLYIGKQSSVKILYILRKANSAQQQATSATLTLGTDWFMLGTTWSDTDDKLKIFVNGVQSGSIATGLASWSSPPTTISVIGSYNAIPEYSMNGYMGQNLLLNRAATPEEMLSVYQAGV